MRMTSSKCVLHHGHLLGYESEPLPKTLNNNPNPNPRTHPNLNPIFNPNRNKVFERKKKRHRNIGQHRVIFPG